MKKCPLCAEEIQDEAIKCRYCGGDTGKGLPNGMESIVAKIFPKKSLLENETLIFEARPVWSGSFTGTIVTAIISFFWAPFWAVTIIILLIEHASWKNTAYGITNKRIVSVSGLFNRSIKQCPLEKVQNTELKTTALNKIGHITFDTAGTTFKEIVFSNLNKPHETFQKINTILHR